MKQLPSILKTLCATAALCCALSANAQNIVSDGGFEASADGAGPHPFSASWTLSPPAGTGAGQQFSNVGGDPSFAHSGSNYANLAPAVGQTGSLSQVLSTTAGTAYAVSFWLANNSSVPVNFFQVYINGVLLTTSMTGTITSPPFSTNGVYQQVFASFVATGGSSTLEFRYRHDDDFWRLDDVSVTRAPEGGAPLWLALSILGGLCLVHFRMRTA
jgi:hypothetical protein